MTRGKRLGVLCGILVVAVGACFGAKLISERAEDADKTSVMNIAAEDITGLSWTYNDETVSITKTDGKWSYDSPETEGDDVNDIDANEMAQAIAELKATAVILPEEQAGDYGFDDPTCEIIVKTASADTTYTVGALNEITGQYNLQITGSENVFTIDTSFVNMFEKGYSDVKATPVPTESPSPSPEATAEADAAEATATPVPTATPEPQS